MQHKTSHHAPKPIPNAAEVNRKQVRPALDTPILVLPTTVRHHRPVTVTTYPVTDSDATIPDSAEEVFDLVIAPDRVPSCPGIGV